MISWSSRGQTILEGVIAVAIVSTILVAVVSAVTLSLSTATIAKNKSKANQFVQEGIEAVRSIKESDWNLLYSQAGVGTPQVKGLVNNAGIWEFSNDTSILSAPQFTREVALEALGSDVKVTVTVTWVQGSNVLSSQNSIVYAKWK